MNKEQQITETEHIIWNDRTEKLKEKASLAGKGIEINLTNDEKIRWVRYRLRKYSPRKFDTKTLNDCRKLLRQGKSLREVSTQKKVGYQVVSRLRMEMRNEEIEHATT